MIRPPPSSTRTDTLFPYTTLFRSSSESDQKRDTRPRTTTGCPGERSSTPPARPIDQPPGDIHETEPWTIGVAGEIARPRSTSCDDSATSPLKGRDCARSAEHTSELQSLMRISYAVFCLKPKKKQPEEHTNYRASQT